MPCHAVLLLIFISTSKWMVPIYLKQDVVTYSQHFLLSLSDFLMDGIHENMFDQFDNKPVLLRLWDKI